MFIRLVLLLLLVSTVSQAQEQQLSSEALALIEKCGSYPPYYGYEFKQAEIEALLEQWLPLHQEWSDSIHQLVKSKKPAIEKLTLIHNSPYAKDPRKINLCGAKLIGLDLTGAFLSQANLTGAFLSQANLTDAFLSQANLTGAFLSQANLTDAFLSQANLTGAFLSQANLTSADLGGAILANTNLSQANLTSADLGGANLNNAVLQITNLTDAHLYKVNLTGAFLRDANFTYAFLREVNLTNTYASQANLTDAALYRTNLTDAFLWEANFTRANLTKTNLSNVFLYETNFNQSIFHPDSKLIPNIDISEFSSKVLRKQEKFFSHVDYYDDEAQEITPAMVMLRNEYKKAGMRASERIVTNLIQTRIEQANIENEDIWKQLEGWLSKIFFNWTTAYGLEPQRALNILVMSVGFFAFIYWLALRIDSKHNQFEIIWESKPQTCNARRGIKAGKQNQDICYPLRLKRTKTGWRNWFWYELKILRIAIYFSFLSAFTIGWRQYNIGNWVRQLQTRDITLRIRKGWIRSVSGFQALMGLYLLVIWMLTQFGRPFE